MRRPSVVAGDAGGSVRGKDMALAVALTLCLAARPGHAQDGESEASPSAEEMIEVARETWGVPGIRRRCPQGAPGDIVVCASDPEEFRVDSPTEEAIRNGEAVPDGVPRAPYVLGLPECGVEVVCHRVGRAPEPVLMIDLAALPHPLTPEEAARVFRAEDLPDAGGPATPEAASPAVAP